MAETGVGLAYTSEYTEYGQARNAADTGTRRYGWLGAAQRAADTPGGLSQMGARLYTPATGRFLSVDPVYGGSANSYDYCAGDSVNCADTTGQWIDCSGSWRSNYVGYSRWYRAWYGWQYNYTSGYNINIRCRLSHFTTIMGLFFGGAVAAFIAAVVAGAVCNVGWIVCAGIAGMMTYVLSGIGLAWYWAACPQSHGIQLRGTWVVRQTWNRIYWVWWLGGGTSTWRASYGYGWWQWPHCNP